MSVERLMSYANVEIWSVFLAIRDDFSCFQVHHGGAGTTAAGLKAAVRIHLLSFVFLILNTS